MMMVNQAGLEPATLCLEGRCSIRLSYWFPWVLAYRSCRAAVQAKSVYRPASSRERISVLTSRSAASQRSAASISSTPAAFT